MNNDNKPNFLDRGTIIAIVVMMAFWFGWSKFMELKYPQPPAGQQTATQKAATQGAGGDVGTPSSAGSVVAGSGQAASETTSVDSGSLSEEKTVDYDSENIAFHFSSRGMGLHDINVKKFQTRTNGEILLGGVRGDYPFATHLVGSDQALNFVIEHPEANLFVGHASADGFNIEKTMRIDPSNYAIDTTIHVTGDLERFKGLTTSLSEQVQTPETTGFFGSSSREVQDWFLRHDGKKTRVAIQTKDAAESNVTIAALSTHYFTIAVSDKSDLLPRFESKVTAGAKTVTGRLYYQPISRVEAFNVHYIGFAGPKSFEVLARADESLSQVVDYGMFGFLAQPILWLLKWLYSIVGNWGVAVILLTLIIRSIVMPFNAYSFKSMKAMQRIQPEMNRIRERYKDKPNDQKLQMNKEIMDLMKANKASPLGGCLPTLLQLPPFFALYQVLGQSIELYRSPFIFWIHDLSARDPYFVLPVLMGATMFAQQRLTPTTMDPQQAKIMMWMPLIFSVFMVSLPSGLTLYIFVSTLFGITQQYFFMRDKSTVSSRVKEAKA